MRKLKFIFIGLILVVFFLASHYVVYVIGSINGASRYAIYRNFKELESVAFLAGLVSSREMERFYSVVDKILLNEGEIKEAMNEFSNSETFYVLDNALEVYRKNRMQREDE